MKTRMKFYSAILTVSLLVGASAQAATRVSLERMDASVNSGIILKSDIRQFRATMKLREQLDPMFPGTPLGQAGANAKDEDIVQFLIDERIIAQQFPVTDPEVEQEINSIQASNHIDRSGLKNAIRAQ